jgi:hypothetical protein
VKGREGLHESPFPTGSKVQRGALRSGSIPIEIEAARGIDDMSELRPADALLINIDGDFGNTIRLLGARLYSDVMADCI